MIPDEHRFLTIGGRIPQVREISDATFLGVQPARSLVPGSSQPITCTRISVQDQQAGGTPYVSRDIDLPLRENLAAGGFSFIVGDSAAGKTRTAYEAIRSVLPNHMLIAPRDRFTISAAVRMAAAETKSVLWLDDAEKFLGPGGLTRADIERILESGQRVVLGTIRTSAYAAYTARGNLSSELHRESLDTLGNARRVDLPRLLSPSEQTAGSELSADSRIAVALREADAIGLGEYLSMAHDLLRRWRDGGNAPGAALVSAAVDCRRAGLTSPLPRSFLARLATQYSGDANDYVGKTLHVAWSWASEKCLARPLLTGRHDNTVQVFDYLVDQYDRSPRPPVPDAVLTAALEHADAADAMRIADTAFYQNRGDIALDAAVRSLSLRGRESGTEHPETLEIREKVAHVLHALGRLAEAQTHHLAILESRTRILGPDDRHTLRSRSNLTVLLGDMGRIGEAEADHRQIIKVRADLLGADDIDTLETRNNLATVLTELGRLDEAEAEARATADVCVRVLGPEHPCTLEGRNNVARMLYARGRLAEAEVEHRAIAEVRARLYGSDHPDTLMSRINVIATLIGMGRLDTAETEARQVIDTQCRVYGPEHPDTLISRNNLAEILRATKRLAEAESEHRATLEARIRTLGPDHPHTLGSRNNLAAVLYAQRRLAEAESEHRATLEARIRTLGPDHPHTLGSRNNLAAVLYAQRRLAEAESEHREIVRARACGKS